MTPKRYGPFPYSPISQRPKLTWPNDARVALWVIPNIEFFGLDDLMPGDPILQSKARIPNVRDWSIREYGNRVGVWSLMEVLSSHGIRATVSLNSEICDYQPQIVEAAVKLGWEFMGHGRTNLERLNEVEPERERQLIHSVLARITKATGRKPVGWLGAGLQETWNTLDYLLEEDCLYVADWLCDDQPFLMDIDGKRMVSIPYSFEVNDWTAFLQQKSSTDDFEKMIKRQFDFLYRQGARSGRVMAIGLHPYIIGVPHRIDALDKALKYICGHDGVWMATGEEIVRHYLKSCKT
ncbi:MAG: polysaccharide deacetylase [Betaproteobacteria bacterium]|nr:polysaccharide deacetylase [Betaproteobacteria bacterium]